MTEQHRPVRVAHVKDLGAFEEEKYTLLRCEAEGIVQPGQFKTLAALTDHLVKEVMAERRPKMSDFEGMPVPDEKKNPEAQVEYEEFPVPLQQKIQTIFATKTEDGGPVTDTTEAEPVESAVVDPDTSPTYVECPEDDPEAEEVPADMDPEDFVTKEELLKSEEIVEISDYEEEEEETNKQALMDQVNAMKNAVQAQADAKRDVIAAMKKEVEAKDQLAQSLSTFAVTVQKSSSSISATYLLKRLTEAVTGEPAPPALEAVTPHPIYIKKEGEVKKEEKSPEPTPSTSATPPAPEQQLFTIEPQLQAEESSRESSPTEKEKIEAAWAALVARKEINPHCQVASVAAEYGVTQSTLNSRWARWLDKNPVISQHLDTRKRRAKKAEDEEGVKKAKQ